MTAKSKESPSVSSGLKNESNAGELKCGSNLEKVLRAGHFAVTAELGPPKGADRSVIEDKASLLKGNADAFNITDCQTALVRLSSIAGGTILKESGLIEPIIQMTCRDRNRLAIQSDLLGAAALGLNNLLCLTGDHQKFGDHPGAKGVYDIDCLQLIQIVKNMRDEKKLQSGEELKVEPRFFIGAAENPFADPFEYRAYRLAKKIRAGADFIQTQIIFNVDTFERWMEKVCELGLHKKAYILAGVAPIKSVGMAKYMKNHVPGMDVPDAIIKRMQDAKKGTVKAEGINVCIDIIERVKKIEGVAGVHVMAIEWEPAVPEIVERAGLLPRPSL